MRWSLTVGRFAGMAVKIHITFLLFLAWIGFSAWREHGAAAARDSIIFIVLLFLCVVLHEFGHILMVRRFGIETPEVTLPPIGGVASLQRLPTKPKEEFLVAIAGPLVNLVIGATLIFRLGGLDASELWPARRSRPLLGARRAPAEVACRACEDVVLDEEGDGFGVQPYGRWLARGAAPRRSGAVSP